MLWIKSDLFAIHLCVWTVCVCKIIIYSFPCISYTLKLFEIFECAVEGRWCDIRCTLNIYSYIHTLYTYIICERRACEQIDLVVEMRKTPDKLCSYAHIETIFYRSRRRLLASQPARQSAIRLNWSNNKSYMRINAWCIICVVLTTQTSCLVVS